MTLSTSSNGCNLPAKRPDIQPERRRRVFYLNTDSIGPQTQAGQKITYIYQRLSVLLQGIRSNQIQTTLARWSSDRGREGARGGGVGRRENSESVWASGLPICTVTQ